jgi:hypothetical protein
MTTAINIKQDDSLQQPVGLEINSKKSLFVLYYRTGMNPHPQNVMFFGEGTMQQIIARAKSFCENTNKRFHLCIPAIIDLDAEEKKYSTT